MQRITLYLVHRVKLVFIGNSLYNENRATTGGAPQNLQPHSHPFTSRTFRSHMYRKVLFVYYIACAHSERRTHGSRHDWWSHHFRRHDWWSQILEVVSLETRLVVSKSGGGLTWDTIGGLKIERWSHMRHDWWSQNREVVSLETRFMVPKSKGGLTWNTIPVHDIGLNPRTWYMT